MANMSVKNDEEARNGLVSIVFTRWKWDARTNGRTHGTTAALLYPVPNNALHGDKKTDWSGIMETFTIIA